MDAVCPTESATYKTFSFELNEDLEVEAGFDVLSDVVDEAFVGHLSAEEEGGGKCASTSTFLVVSPTLIESSGSSLISKSLL